MRKIIAAIVWSGVTIATIGGAAVFALRVHAQNPASLYVGPASGTFVVGSTFSVAVYLNTSGNNVNAVDATLYFPASKLQIVSPTAGKSLIQIWVAQPTYDNQKGILRFQGAIPTPGVNTDAGVVSQITFRVVGLGTALVSFGEDSQVLLNDGRGTNILGQTTSGLFHLILPPPAGPAVTSATHPDQEKWYSNKTVSLEWTTNEDKVTGFSYVMSDQPVDAPDDISDGDKTRQTYKNLADGIHYFHIKTLRDGNWGGITHYAIHIDTTPPADFPIQISPSDRTTIRKPAVMFETTDELSSIDHYEIQVISLNQIPLAGAAKGAQGLFVEAKSPYVTPELEFGDYDVVVRAFDQAGNYLQKTQRLQIITHIFDIVLNQGIKVRSNVIISWMWVYIIIFILIIILGYLVRVFWTRHRMAHERLESGELPDSVRRQLEELKTLKEKYQKTAFVLLLGIVGLASLFLGPTARAETVELSPPIIDVVARNISNQDIFYISGSTEAAGSVVVVYLQNLQTGETGSHNVEVDKNGKWFYTHSSFLSGGNYMVWVQNKVGPVESPPSPQVELTVSPTALQLGSSRLSYAFVFLVIAIILFIILIILFGAMVYHYRTGKKKHAKFVEETRHAEELVRRGFALLHRDIQSEFKLLEQSKASRGLTEEEEELEQKIFRDLQTVKNYVGKELWEIEQKL